MAFTGCGTGSFYVSHRKELLDYPGEWFLDEGEAKLYLVTSTGSAPSPTVYAPTVAVLFKVAGTQGAPVRPVFPTASHISFV